MSAGHPQIAQCKQCHQLRRVFRQPFVANLGESELTLDDSERVLHLGPHTGFELLSLIEQFAPQAVPVQCPTLARAHLYFLLNASSFRPLGYTLITGIGKHH